MKTKQSDFICSSDYDCSYLRPMNPKIMLLLFVVLFHACSSNEPIKKKKVPSDFTNIWKKNGDTLIFTRYKCGYLYARKTYIHQKLRHAEIFDKEEHFRHMIEFNADGTPMFMGGLTIFHQKKNTLFIRNSKFDVPFEVLEIANPIGDTLMSQIEVLDTLQVTKCGVVSSVDLSKILQRKKSTYLEVVHLYQIDEKTFEQVPEFVFIGRGVKVDTYNLHGFW
jgi:hypothetical protein